MKNNKFLLIVIAVVVPVACGAFYGGMVYGKNASSAARAKMFALGGTNVGGNFFANGGSAFGGQGRQGVAGARGGQFGGGVSGDIISKDDKSIIVKLRDGGSKIVFFSDATAVTKSLDGTLTDLEVGKTAMVGGQTGADGSIIANTIQLRSVSPTQPAAAQK